MTRTRAGLKSTLETFADDIFTDLEEPLTKVVAGITSGVQFLADAWGNLGPSAKTAVAALLGLAAAAGPVLLVVGSVAGAVLGLAGSIASLITAGAAVGGLAALGSILLPVTAVIAGLIIVITEWVAIAVGAAFAIHQAWTTNFLGVRDLTFRAWNAIKDFLLRLWEELRAAYALIWPQLKTLTQTVLGAIQAFWTAHGEKIVAVIRFAWNVVTTVIRTAVRVVSSLVAGVLAVINGDWEKAWDMAVRAVEAFLNAFYKLHVLIGNAIVSLVAHAIVQAVRFYQAGVQLATRLIVGIIAEIFGGMPRIAAAVVTAAAMLAMPSVLAAFAAAGVAQARARNEAFEANIKNPAAPADDTNPGRQDVWGTYGPQGGTLPGNGTSGTGTGTKGLPAGSGGGGGSKGENAAVRKFKLEAQIAEVLVQTVERLNQKLLADAGYYYSQGVQQLDQYVAAKRKAAEDLFRAENERNNQEASALEASGVRGRQRVLAEAQLSEQVKATWQKYNTAKADIDRFAATETLATQRAAQEAQIALAQESASGMESVWTRLAERGVATFAEAHRRIAESQLAIMRMQGANLLGEMGRYAPGTAAFAQAEAAWLQHKQRLANFYQQMGLDQKDAQQRTGDSLLQHKARIQSINDTIADMEMDTQRDRLRILEQMGLSKEIVWQREVQLELQIEDQRRARRIEDLKRERDYVTQFQAEGEKKREALAQINAQIEAEDARSAQRRENIIADFHEKQRAKLREAADKVVNVFKSALDQYRTEGWRGFFKSLGESFRDQLEQMALDLLKSRVLSLLQTVFKIPQLSTGQASASGGSASGPGFDFGGVITGLFQRVFGGNQQAGGKASATGSIDAAGEAMTEAISKGGERAASGVEKQGLMVAGRLTSIGQGIVSTMLQVGSMLAAANTRGSFWKGLLMAAGMGAVNGLAGGVFGAGSGSQGGIGSAAAGAINGLANGGVVNGPGHDTSDNILGLDARTKQPTAWVSPQEFVVNAAMTRKHRGLIEAINADRLPRYGWGGFLKALSPIASLKGAVSPLLSAPRVFAPALSSVRNFSPITDKKKRQFLSPFSALFGLAGGGMVGSGYMPPRMSPVLSAAGGGTVHKHYHLNVTHRGGSDPKEIQKSVAQVRRGYSEMIQRTASDLN